ncbi:MAG: ATP-binding protein [Gemmatimonadota bacterium]|nr:MAG: ATP-binding protein [Gemmatimonadota bacterium]
MDSGGILLVDLSGVGYEIREILGCFLLSLLHLTALSRGSVPTDAHRPFHVYCDEAHRFMTEPMEDIIAETRKFNVSLTLAHQYLSQFNKAKTDALSSVGSTIIFNVDTRDAQYLKKDLQGLVDVNDLITQDVGHAIARIATHVVRLETQRPLDIPKENCREFIVERSRARYCRPVDEVRRAIRARGEPATGT